MNELELLRELAKAVLNIGNLERNGVPHGIDPTEYAATIAPMARAALAATNQPTPAEMERMIALSKEIVAELQEEEKLIKRYKWIRENRTVVLWDGEYKPSSRLRGKDLDWAIDDEMGV